MCELLWLWESDERVRLVVRQQVEHIRRCRGITVHRVHSCPLVQISESLDLLGHGRALLGALEVPHLPVDLVRERRLSLRLRVSA